MKNKLIKLFESKTNDDIKTHIDPLRIVEYVRYKLNNSDFTLKDLDKYVDEINQEGIMVVIRGRNGYYMTNSIEKINGVIKRHEDRIDKMKKQVVNLRKVLLEKEMNEPKFDFRFEDYTYTYEGKIDYELKDEDELWG